MVICVSDNLIFEQIRGEFSRQSGELQLQYANANTELEQKMEKIKSRYLHFQDIFSQYNKDESSLLFFGNSMIYTRDDISISDELLSVDPLKFNYDLGLSVIFNKIEDDKIKLIFQKNAHVSRDFNSNYSIYTPYCIAQDDKKGALLFIDGILSHIVDEGGYDAFLEKNRPLFSLSYFNELEAKKKYRPDSEITDVSLEDDKLGMKIEGSFWELRNLSCNTVLNETYIKD